MNHIGETGASCHIRKLTQCKFLRQKFNYTNAFLQQWLCKPYNYYCYNFDDYGLQLKKPQIQN